MSNFTYVASGSITLGGCSTHKATKFLYYQFAIGSIVFSKPKAEIGIYEKIVVKKVQYMTCQNCTLTPLYTDTYNSIWNEKELVSYSNAKLLVDAFFELQDILSKKAALKCL